MTLFSKLRRLFFGKPNAIQTRDGARRLAFRSSRPNWILGRGLCMYRCEDFTDVPRSKRKAALDFKLPVWSPFERTGHHAVWSGGVAMVWFWDRDRTGPAREEFASLFPKWRGRTADRLRILPETVFYERRTDGLHLQPCVDGFEMQRWHGDVLTDAFWFSERPQEDQFSWFLSRQESDFAAFSSTVKTMPEPAADRMVFEPWSVSRDPQGWMERVPSSLAAACLLGLVLLLLWQEARYWKIRQLEDAATGELNRLEERIDPLLEARTALIRLHRTNLALLDLLRGPSQADLMSEVDRAIPSPEAKFREWRYRQGELRVSVEDRKADPIAYIRALEAVALFDRVRAEPGNGGNRLELTLRVAR